MAGRKRKKASSSSSSSSSVSEDEEKARYMLMEATRENDKMIVNNAKLEIDLKYANHQVLRRNLMGSARGVIECFERHHKMPPHIREDTRFNRWYWIFENDRSFRHKVDESFGSRPRAGRVASSVATIFENDRSFRHKVDEFFGSRPRAGRVASSVATIFGKASSRIVSFCTIQGLLISASNYTLEEQNILQAICDTIPCKITMAGRKRKKASSSSSSDSEEEKKRLDFRKKYFKLKKECKKAKDMLLGTTRQNHKVAVDSAKLEIDLEFANHLYFRMQMVLRRRNDVCQEMNEENIELAVSNAKLEIDLKYTNSVVLRMDSMLSARGVIEWFERHHHTREGSRFNRWYWIFENDRSFRHKVDESFGSRPRAGRVASTVATIFDKASSRIPSFGTLEGLQISATNYTLEEQNILQAICDTIPCKITIE